MAGERRLFVGDLHGCREELNDLLVVFGFRKGTDRLYSVGDVVGKGPDVPGALKLLRDMDASVVVGNHELALLKAADPLPGRSKSRDRDYLDGLGEDKAGWIAWIKSWPYYLDLGDVLLVHAGLEPGKKDPATMDIRILTRIRTWDGKGHELDRPEDPPWFECTTPEKTVVFGHWARRGLVDRPKVKGLDTGCVYGGKLTGWSPEENRFFQVPARRAYLAIEDG